MQEVLEKWSQTLINNEQTSELKIFESKTKQNYFWFDISEETIPKALDGMVIVDLQPEYCLIKNGKYTIEMSSEPLLDEFAPKKFDEREFSLTLSNNVDIRQLTKLESVHPSFGLTFGGTKMEGYLINPKTLPDIFLNEEGLQTSSENFEYQLSFSVKSKVIEMWNANETIMLSCKVAFEFGSSVSFYPFGLAKICKTMISSEEFGGEMIDGIATFSYEKVM